MPDMPIPGAPSHVCGWQAVRRGTPNVGDGNARTDGPLREHIAIGQPLLAACVEPVPTS